MLEGLSLEGKVVIVTGGGSGLGKAMAISLAGAGADVVVAGRRLGPLEEVAAEVKAYGRRALAIPTDISDSDQVNRMVQLVSKDFGDIDVLVNNAGQPGQPIKPIWEVTDAEWYQGLQINLTGTFYCCRAVTPYMIQRGRGRILNVSSHFGMRSVRDYYAYSVAKAGVIQLTRSLAVSLARHGVSCVTLVPGPFVTEGTAKLRKEMPHADHVPVGYFALSESIGPAVVFLASDASLYLNGEIFPIDGGVTTGGIAPTGYAPIIPWKSEG